jgi:hypothetical protein
LGKKALERGDDMNKILMAIAVVIVVAGVPQAQASCDEEDIDTVSSDGKIIELLDGSVWRSLDPATSSTWLATETVLVCNDDVMINKDENGEKVDVVRE